MLNHGLSRNIRLLTAINMILSVFLVLSLLLLMRDILSPEFNPSTGASQFKAKVNPSVVERSLKDLEPVLKKNPFGFSGGELRPITGTEDSSSFDMRLVGTVSGGINYAIFLTKEGKQEVFKRGERIFNSGILERVYKDKVVIQTGGRKREIPLSDILTIENTNVDKLGSKEQGATSLVRSSGNNTFIVNQEGILHALENPSQLMTDARLQPNYVNGHQEGFMLREVKNGGIYQSLGLQNGDVLLRINNYDITNPEIALQAFTALKGMDRVGLDIIRNGTRMTLNYQIR
ncbi:MAG: type II secretion system protein N [Thermodesulfovibrionales bacterium]